MQLSSSNDPRIFETIHMAVAAGKLAIVALHEHDMDPNISDEEAGRCLRFIYTVGLTLKGLPELICFFPDDNYAEDYTSLLSQYADKMKAAGVAFDENQLDDEFCKTPVMFKNLSPHQFREWVGPCCEYLESNHKQWPQFMQVVIPDRNGKQANDPDYEHEYMREQWGQQLLYQSAPATLN